MAKDENKPKRVIKESKHGQLKNKEEESRPNTSRPTHRHKDDPKASQKE